MSAREQDSWKEWKNHVLHQIDEIKRELDMHRQDSIKYHEKMLIEITSLKAKASMWGAVAGSVVAILTLAAQVITGK